MQIKCETEMYERLKLTNCLQACARPPGMTAELIALLQEGSLGARPGRTLEDQF